MFGLTSQVAKTQGLALRKPWTIATTCDQFMGLGRLCDGSHSHTRIQGRDTKLTEAYTDELADAIHQCWRKQCGH